MTSVIGPSEATEAEPERSPFDAFKPRRKILSPFDGGPPFVRRRARPRGSIALLIAGTWVGFMLFLVIAANWLPIPNPIRPVGIPNAAPHWGRDFLGLDAVGRSMISRLVFGTRVSYLIAICATLVAMVVGCGLGLLAAYFRGTVNFLADWVSNIILSIPGLLLLLTIAVVLKPSLKEIIGAIALVHVPGFIRLTKAIALPQLEREYVLVARGLGASSPRIILRELLPSTLTALITYCGIVLPGVMLIEGGLSYVGYGVPAPRASWGQMIAQGQANIAQYPWPAIIPALLFAVNVFALYTLADWLRARVDLKGIDKTT